MHFRAAASVAILACATHVAAEPQPYKLAMMPIPGMALLRRSTNGYQPEQTHCGAGDSCAAACGTGYTQCASTDSNIHCFDPAAGQACCNDGTGNSCDAGYYCTHDTKSDTMCCPDSMDLTQCAAAYSVTGGLQTDSPTTSTTPSSTSTPTSTKEATTTTEIEKATVTKPCASSSGYSTAWTGSNSTITTNSPTMPSQVVPPPSIVASTTRPAVATGTSAAGANSVSALLLAAAGVLAFL